MIIKTVKVSEKGQIALPVDIRKQAGINRGDDLIIFQDKGKIMIEKAMNVSKDMKDHFRDLLKHSESVAEKLWSTKADDIWDK